MIKKYFQILKILQEAKQEITAKDICLNLLDKGIDVSIRTIYKDIEEINELAISLINIPLIKARKNKGYSLNYDYFSDGQLQFLLDTIAYNPNIDGQEAKRLQNLLLNFASNSQQARLMITKNNEDNEINYFLNLTNIIKAINKESNIRFNYINYAIKDGKIVEVNSNKGNHLIDTYVISPYQVYLSGGNYYVQGYLDSRKDTYTIFRLDRMKRVMLDSSNFVDIREQYDLNQEQNSLVNNFSGNKQDLMFAFDKSIFREVVNRFGKNIEVVKEGQWIEVIIKDVAISQGLLGWFLMMNNNVKIIYPQKLKEDLLIKLDNIKDLY